VSKQAYFFWESPIITVNCKADNFLEHVDVNLNIQKGVSELWFSYTSTNSSWL